MSNQKTALIFGVTGQAGSYLAEHLVSKKYTVHAVKRRSSSLNTQRVDHIYQDPHEANRNFIMHYGDVTDPTSVMNVIKKIQPDEIYNMAAQSHVDVSFKIPVYTTMATALGVVHILEAIHSLGMVKKVKFLQASSSEMFGKVQAIPQDENTKFYPRSPYGCAKVFGFDITRNYREAYGLFAANSICFNMESPRRGETFVTRKITRGLAAIVKGKEQCIYLGNLNAKRDWGHVKDYVQAMHLMLQAEHPDDYVVATGKTMSVRKFAEKAFAQVDIELKFSGEGDSEIATVVSNEGIYPVPVGQTVIKVDPKYYRPAEVDILVGNAEKARSVLGWKPEYTIEKIIAEMVESDIKNFS